MALAGGIPQHLTPFRILTVPISRACIAILLFSISVSAAEKPYLVIDLPGNYQVDSLSFAYTSPIWTTIDGTAWFGASRQPLQEEVWRTDGTPEGTVQVTNVGGTKRGHADGPYVGFVNGRLIYAGYYGERRLFALPADGTVPVILATIARPKWEARITPGPVMNGYLYFAATFDYRQGFELWRTDGTTAGTTCLDLYPGSPDSLNLVSPLAPIRIGDSLWFYAATSAAAKGLHRSDGTSSGTKFIRPGSPIGVIGDSLIFKDTGPDGKTIGIWATDGSNEVLLLDGFLSAGDWSLGAPGPRLYFQADDGVNGSELWVTDGTPGGTTLVADLTPRGITSYYQPGLLVGSQYFFTSTVYSFGSCRRTLYVTEGTAESTRGTCLDNLGTDYLEGFASGDRYCFGFNDPATGRGVWCTDGSPDGLRRMVDLAPWSLDGFIWNSSIALGNGLILFAGRDRDTGAEPWITDGTPEGSRMLKNIGADNEWRGSNPDLLRASLDRVFFTATVRGAATVGVSDGSGAGTSTAETMTGGLTQAEVSGGRYYFAGSRSLTRDQVLGVSDGTPAGTTHLLSTGHFSRFAPIRNGVIFADSQSPLTVYFTDGTVAGTRPLASRGGGSGDVDVFEAGGMGWFSLGGLKRSDGTAEGTRTLLTLEGDYPTPIGATTLGPHVYLLGYQNGPERGLWRASTTNSELERIAVLDGGGPASISSSSHYVYIVIGDGLWRSDGTEAGTIRLPATKPSTTLTSCVSSPAFLGDTLVWLSATNSAMFLWRSDGTPETTVVIATFPIAPYRTSSPFPCPSLAAAGGKVYFPGATESTGLELWTTDGTPEGTVLLEDIWPGARSSAPAGLTVAGDHIFFSAATVYTERELWVIDTRDGTRRRRAVRN